MRLTYRYIYIKQERALRRLREQDREKESKRWKERVSKRWRETAREVERARLRDRANER